MGPFGWVVSMIVFISFMTFVTFFGRLPQLRNTPISFLHHLLVLYIPNALWALDRQVTGGRIIGKAQRFFHAMMHDRHPTTVIFFILILFTAESLFLPPAWPKLSAFTKFTAVIAVFLPYFFLYLSCAADPGYITPENHAYHMSLYPYDFAIFHPGHVCRTCNLIKPPRSKHCSICKRCIARADHHCIFINGCVGYGNHHWFLLLLFSTAVLCTYGALLGMSLLTTIIKARYPTFTLWPHATMPWSKYGTIWSFAISKNMRLGASTLLAGLISPLVWGLFLYTVWLIYCGTTTNESLKWSDMQEDVQDGYAFERSLLPSRRLASGETPWTRWPCKPERILVPTKDGRPPRAEQELPGIGEWVRPKSMKDVENVYDLGLWLNLVDIFVSEPDFGSASGLPTSERRRKPSKNGRAR